MTGLKNLIIMPPVAHGGAAAREKDKIGLPASPDAERAVLGAVLADNDALYEVGSELLSEHFSLTSHRVIYGAMFDLREDGKSIDLVTLTDILGKRGELSKIGGAAYVAGLSEAYISGRSVPGHVKLLKEKASLRRVIAACDLAKAKAMEQDETAESIVAQCEIDLQEILAETGAVDEIKRIGDYSDEYFAELESVRSYKQELIGLTYGLSNVDFATTGLRNGETTVIGGRPGAGKSSMALGIALANGQDMVPVYYYSAEMRGNGLFSRTLSALTRINNFRLRDPRQLTAEDDKKLAIAADETRLLPVWIDDRPGLDITQIIARARLWMRKHAAKVNPEKAVTIFDFAQLIKAEGKDRVERVGNVAEAVAMFAREVNRPAVLLSQLNRPDRKNTNVRPTMDDLKESGRLEENADVVGLLYRAVGEKQGEDEFIIAKQRNGPLGTEKVSFDKETLMYTVRD